MRRLLTIAAVALLSAPLATAASAADVESGKELFGKCKSCHTVGPDAKHGVGPQLNGIVGRKAGSLADFKYSDSMKAEAAKGLVWTEATLDKYLANPKAVVPAGSMVFAGFKDKADRDDVIAYLKSAGK
ncbi:MAG: cytochrome c family protein [Hyphomicrobiaceae bacterium]